MYSLQKIRAIAEFLNSGYSPKNRRYRPKWPIPTLFSWRFIVLPNECDNRSCGPTPTVLKPLM